DGVVTADREVPRGVALGPGQDLGDVPLCVVVAEDRGVHVGGCAVAEQEDGRPGDRVGGGVHIDPAVPVAVPPAAAGVLAGGMSGGSAPVVGSGSTDPDLHRAGRAETVVARVDAWAGSAAVLAFHFADSGQYVPGDPVGLSGLLIQGQVVGGDAARGGRGR